MQIVSEKTPQQKIRKWYIRDPELRELVRYCVKKRLTKKVAVERLSQLGHDISTKTFQRMKKDIESPKLYNLEKLTGEEYKEFTIGSIETLKTVEDELWLIEENAVSSWEKMNALDRIVKVRKDMAEFYDSSPVAAKISKLLAERKENGNVVEESQQSS